MRERRFGLMAGVLMLAPWLCGAAWAQDAAPTPDAGMTAPDAFSKGRLAPQLEAQVRAIVMEQLTAAVPQAEEGSVSVFKVEKGTAVSATLAGEPYRGSVYRTFLVEGMKQENQGVKEFYIRTTTPWKFRDGVVAPAETYFSLLSNRVLAFNAARVAAQDDAIAKSEALRKAALDQAEQERKAKAKTPAPYQAQMDELSANVSQLESDATQEQDARTTVAAHVNQELQRRRSGQSTGGTAPNVKLSGKDPKGKLLWQYQGGQLTFYDNFDKTMEDLTAAREEQGALQATMVAEQAAAAALFSRKAQALRAVATRERKRILWGEQIGEDDMRADYEVALGEALKAGAASESEPAASAQPK